MSDAKLPKPPKTYTRFTEQFPLLAEAWDKTSLAGAEGPLDEKTARLVKLAVAAGAMREGAVRSNARKAAALGVDPAALYQVVALAAGTLGFPSTVAVYSWLESGLAQVRDKD